MRIPFLASALIDVAAFTAAASIAVRFLDNILEISRYPLSQQRDQAMHTRRVGLGVAGLADALIMLGLRYDSVAAREQAASILHSIRDAGSATANSSRWRRQGLSACSRETFRAASNRSSLSRVSGASARTTIGNVTPQPIVLGVIGANSTLQHSSGTHS